MKRILALGFFDGLHRGHAALMSKTIERAMETGAEPCVLSFDRPPLKNVKQINSLEDKLEGINRMFSIKSVIMLTFDDELRRMSWTDFAAMLVEKYGACGFVAGYDFRFGYMGEGDVHKLKRYARERGLTCDIVERVTFHGETVSSTLIRSLLESGDIYRANDFLGHMHYLSGVVRHGRRIGHTLGFPTVNLSLPEGVKAPRFGVYETEIATPKGFFRAITNVGVNPTVSDSGAVSVESHLLGFDGDLYGERIRIDFKRFIRPEMRYDSLDDLRTQIMSDIKYFDT